MTEQWNQAVAYVQALRGQGYGDSDIATALRGGGWTEGEIQALLTGAPRPAVAPPAAPQPPPPALAPPPLVAPAQVAPPPSYAPPSAPAGGSRGPLIALIVVAAVVLLALFAVGAFVAVSRTPGLPPSVARTEEQSLPKPPAENSKETATVPEGAGEEAALAQVEAVVGEGKWDFAVSAHSPDWREVSVWCKSLNEGDEDWVEEVGLRWGEDGSYGTAYRLNILAAEPKPAEAQEVLAWEGRPCLAGALIAARVDAEEDWISLAASRNRDWTHAVIWVGPPASEYAEIVTVKWDPARKQYDVAEKQALEGDEMPPDRTELTD